VGQVEKVFDAFANVIRVEDGIFRRLTNAGSIGQRIGQRTQQHAKISAVRANAPYTLLTVRVQNKPPFFLYDYRHRQNRLKFFFYEDRARTWTTAAMRRRKSFMQIQVHYIDAEISRTSDSGKSIHVRAVHIDECAALVADCRNFRDAIFEYAQRIRIGQHDRGDFFGNHAAKMVRVDLSALVRFDVLDFVARDDGGRGIRTVRGIGNQHTFARVTATFQAGANHQQARRFALSARGRLKSDRVHASDREQALLQIPQNTQAALRNLIGLHRVLARNAVQAGDKFIH